MRAEFLLTKFDGLVDRRIVLRLGILLCCLVCLSLSSGCSQESKEVPATPEVKVNLATYGLPPNFFREGYDTKCSSEIIGYRFVVWLDRNNVAVGFNTSPNCRLSRNRTVDGMARILLFDSHGTLNATRDVSYLADGNGELVADGEAMAGPVGTLLFRMESVNLDPSGAAESKSGVLLLDSHLKDVARLDQFLEQTTFVDHALVFQNGFTLTGPRTYSVINGLPPIETQRWLQDWPIGAMDRKFGEHELAYMLCEQELQPNTYTASNVVHAGVKRRCSLNVERKDQTDWSHPLKEDGSAAIVGILADGGVAGQINVKGSPAGRLVIWKKDQTEEQLPWIPANYEGSIASATTDMSRYATLAQPVSESCQAYGINCAVKARWIVFDRKSPKPIANRAFPNNGRAALSPDGLRYATFESGEFRIYSLPKP